MGVRHHDAEREHGRCVRQKRAYVRRAHVSVQGPQGEVRELRAAAGLRRARVLPRADVRAAAGAARHVPLAQPFVVDVRVSAVHDGGTAGASRTRAGERVRLEDDGVLHPAAAAVPAQASMGQPHQHVRDVSRMAAEDRLRAAARTRGQGGRRAGRRASGQRGRGGGRKKACNGRRRRANLECDVCAGRSRMEQDRPRISPRFGARTLSAPSGRRAAGEGFRGARASGRRRGIGACAACGWGRSC